jgi:hypothetical protein
MTIVIALFCKPRIITGREKSKAERRGNNTEEDLEHCIQYKQEKGTKQKFTELILSS